MQRPFLEEKTVHLLNVARNWLAMAVVVTGEKVRMRIGSFPAATLVLFRYPLSSPPTAELIR